MPVKSTHPQRQSATERPGLGSSFRPRLNNAARDMAPQGGELQSQLRCLEYLWRGILWAHGLQDSPKRFIDLYTNIYVYLYMIEIIK